MTLNRVAVFTVALAAALVTDAAAQTLKPSLTVSSQGRSVTIEWSSVDGALGYNLHVGTATGASDVAAVNLPDSIRRIVVAAPLGRYFLRVRGITLSIQGPYSDEVSVTVSDQVPAPTPNPTPNPSPGPGCQQPSAPSPSANVGGDQSVTISWNGVGGATGYRVEFGRSSGSTDLVQNVPAHQTSFKQPVGMAGTFYARVVAGNACGSTTSQTIAFTIEGSTPGTPGGPTGSGPRTPNPTSGRLPVPGYGRAVAEAMASTYRGDLQNSCAEHGGNNTWMFRVVNELRKRDSRWGLNWKRGRTGDLSQDIVTYNYGSNADEGTTDVYIIDIIGGHCGGSPDWNFQDQTEATRAGGGIGRWTLQPYLRAGFPGDARE